MLVKDPVYLQLNRQLRERIGRMQGQAGAQFSRTCQSAPSSASAGPRPTRRCPIWWPQDCSNSARDWARSSAAPRWTTIFRPWSALPARPGRRQTALHSPAAIQDPGHRIRQGRSPQASGRFSGGALVLHQATPTGRRPAGDPGTARCAGAILSWLVRRRSAGLALRPLDGALLPAHCRRGTDHPGRESPGQRAQLLEVPRGSAAFLVTSTGYLQPRQPLWWEQTLYRGDAYEFHNFLGPIRPAAPATGALRS